MRKLKSFIQCIAFIAKWAGATLLLLSIIGAFEYPQRKELYNKLQTQKTISARSKITNKLMKDFGFPIEQVQLINTITFTSITWGGSGHSIAGVIIAQTSNGKQRTICEMNEMHSWAYSESRLYNWLSFILIFFGLIVESILRYKNGIEQNK